MYLSQPVFDVNGSPHGVRQDAQAYSEIYIYTSIIVRARFFFFFLLPSARCDPDLGRLQCRQ